MNVINTSMTSDGSCWVITQKVAGLRDLIAVVIAEDGCRHTAETPEAFCLLDPPSWMWLLGVPSYASVGRLMNKVANWAINVQDKLPVVERRQVEFEVLVETYGWARTSPLDD